MGKIQSNKVWSESRAFGYNDVLGNIVFINTTPDAGNINTVGQKTEVQSQVNSGILNAPGSSISQVIMVEAYQVNRINSNVMLAVSSTNIYSNISEDRNNNFIFVAPTDIVYSAIALPLTSTTDTTAEDILRAYSIITITDRNFVLPYQFISNISTFEFMIGIWTRRTITHAGAGTNSYSGQLAVRLAI